MSRRTSEGRGSKSPDPREGWPADQEGRPVVEPTVGVQPQLDRRRLFETGARWVRLFRHPGAAATLGGPIRTAWRRGGIA